MRAIGLFFMATTVIITAWGLICIRRGLKEFYRLWDLQFSAAVNGWLDAAKKAGEGLIMDISALTATIKCKPERLFFSKKRKVAAWVVRGTVNFGKTSVPFDVAIIADGKEIAAYNRAPEPMTDPNEIPPLVRRKEG